MTRPFLRRTQELSCRAGWIDFKLLSRVGTNLATSEHKISADLHSWFVGSAHDVACLSPVYRTSVRTPEGDPGGRAVSIEFGIALATCSLALLSLVRFGRHARNYVGRADRRAPMLRT